ncbi:hypothetical protein [Nocardia sp. NPDC059228]|uniref:phage major capsid protein n=1 Tax=Nocardia sp. NPDC059228 TaxID=3346777 RepID=UPI00369E2C08
MTGNVTFAPTPATLTGDVISINRFLKDPIWVMRALRTITEQMFIANKILTAQLWTESGTVGYQQNENIYADNSPQPVAPGAEYPTTTTGTGTASMANTINWGQDSVITDASISRQKFDVVGRAFTKLANSHVQKIDSVGLSAAASAVTQNTGAIASWAGTGATPMIFRDIMRAYASLINLKQGYMPDTLLMDTVTYANVVSDDKLMALLPREIPGFSNAPVQSGWDSPYMKRIGGFTFLGSPNLPVAGVATLLDSKVFGGFTDEKQPAPGYVMSTGKDGLPDADGLQVKTIREDTTDSWRIRCRRITVPIVLEPRAAWQITGVNL